MNISVLGVHHYPQFYPLRPFPECLASICAVINRERTILYNSEGEVNSGGKSGTRSVEVYI